jgi:O-antigen/teichoic acid export membrane protein
MNSTELAAFVTLMIGLSIATERLVEIVKGFVGFLGTEQADADAERRRKALLQILAVAAGIFTAWSAADYVPDDIAKPTESWKIIGLGLLASGGSGFWNSIATYFLKVKDLKKIEVEEKKPQ